jgi:hypothetical protein
MLLTKNPEFFRQKEKNVGFVRSTDNDGGFVRDSMPLPGMRAVILTPLINLIIDER